MKILFFGALACTFAINISAQTTPVQRANSGAPDEAGYSIVQRDADSRVWERTVSEINSSGETVQHVHHYTDLATGLHYKDPKTGEWVESSDQIEILPNGGAQAIHGQHQVYFPPDIYDGVIEIVTSDGKHLKSRPIGISYDDGKHTVLIAELKHSVGQLLPTGNQVIYTNAFTDVDADLVCTYRKSGFECDLIFREQPIVPESFGLRSEESRIQLLTEFFDTPEPEQIAAPTVSALPNAPAVFQASSEELPDVSLKFGAMTMIRGRAFAVDEAETRGKPPTSGIPVSKTWAKIDARTVLVESVPLTRMNSQLRNLPKSSQLFTQASVPGSVRYRVSKSPLLPTARIASVSTKVQRFAEAKSIATRGVVLDYNLVNPTLTDFTFKGDTTYLVTGLVSLNGTTTIEGGSVIKFVQTNACFLEVAGGVNCATSPYRPAVFTSIDDNSVGETISGSSGNPVVDSNNWYLYLYVGNLQLNLHDLRLEYCYVGIAKVNEPGVDLRDIQFVHTAWPVYFFSFVTNASQCSLRNVLMTDVTGAAIELGNIDLDIEHLTLDRCARLGYMDYTANLRFTNSLLVGIQAMGDIPYTTNYSILLTTNTGVFQTVGAGHYYLATNSPYRDAGTTNINSVLVADLSQKTTYPPLLYTNVGLSTNVALNPAAQRDNDLPDLGYHYDPIDYLFDTFLITNATLTVSPGTAIASYGDSGIVMTDGSTIASVGTVLSPIWYTKHFCVQEEPTIRGSSPSSSLIVNPYHSGAAPLGQYRFSKFSTVGNVGYLLYHGLSNWAYSNLLVQDCEFWGGANSFSGYNNSQANLKNNLFVRSTVSASASGITNVSLVASNNLFWNDNFFVVPFSNSNSWIFFNNAFDHSTNGFGFGSPNFVNGYNAYIGDTNVTIRMMPIGSGDVLISNMIYQSGPLGGFYQPTASPLINNGSVASDAIALYHYTTQTNQAEEAKSIVDIGYHYVALDPSGSILDSDDDSLPDWWEMFYFGSLSYNDTNIDSLGNTFKYDSDNGLVPKKALGYWRFDNTNTWVGDRGQLPLIAQNVTGVPSWNTNAVLIDSMSPAVLTYRDVEASGDVNINLANGTLEFWFKPDWSSPNLGGVGPQNEGRFIELGGAGSSNGWWGLMVSSTGTNIYFCTGTNAPQTVVTNLSAPISWRSNTWHQIVLTYCSTNSSVYLDGQAVITNGAGVAFYPGPAARAQGFTIGSSAYGTNQAAGTFEDLCTFNYLLSASAVSSNYASAGVPDPAGLEAWWQAEDNTMDATGLNPAGLIEGTVSYAPGEVGQAFSFGGASDVHVVASPNLEMGAAGAGMTVEGWIQTSILSTNAYYVSLPTYELVESDSGAGNAGFVLAGSAISQGDLFAQFEDATGNIYYLYSAGDTLLSNVFCHVAVTYDPDSGVASLYCNGVQVASQNFGVIAIQKCRDLYIGNGPTYGLGYNGVLDELSIYGRALSSAEIAAVYKAGSAGKRAIAPVIVTQPVSQNANIGDNVNFSVLVSGTSPLSYQWFDNGIAIAGATGSSYVKQNVQATDAGNYTVVVQNISGSVTSAAAVLSIGGAPVISQGPQDQSANPNGSVTFSVTATGSSLQYKWKHAGNLMANQTSSTLTLNNVQVADAGNYSVDVYNAYGQAGANANLLILASQGNYLFTLSGAAAGSTYDLYVRPSLSSGVKYRLYYAGMPGQTIFQGPPMPAGVFSFFQAGSAADFDKDGLTDGYEALVSFSQLNNPDSDGVGMPDGWKVEFGLDPTSSTGNNAASADPDGDNIPNFSTSQQNLGEFQRGTDPWVNNSTAGRPVISVSYANGAFTITRTGTAGTINVNYAIGGTAVYGTDYTFTPSPNPSTYPFTVSIPGSTGNASVTLTPNTIPAGKTMMVAIVPIAISDQSNPALWPYVVDPFHDRANANTPVVSVTASIPTAQKVGPINGQFTVSCSPAPISDILVNVTPGGNATAGTDYQPINSPVKISAGTTSTTVAVVPILNGTAGSQTVTLAASAGSGYTVGSPNSATVTIQPAPVVTVSASIPTAKKAGPVGGQFTVSCTPAMTADTIINVQVTGTASAGGDYQNVGTVKILAGQTSTTVAINPMLNGATVDKTVILTILSSANYFVGNNNSATVNIEAASTVTITASTPDASENGVNGVFTITRSWGHQEEGPLTVLIQQPIGGSAKLSAPANYTMSPSSVSVTIPAGSTTTTVTTSTLTVTPINDHVAAGTLTVIPTIQANANYFVGTSKSATVNIWDADKDTDGDGIMDGMEILKGYNPLTKYSINNVPDGYQDKTGDGLANLLAPLFNIPMWTANTGWRTDSDGDGVPDSLDSDGLDLPPTLSSYGKCPIQ